MLITVSIKGPLVFSGLTQRRNIYFSAMAFGIGRLKTGAGKNRSGWSCDGITPAEIKNSVAPQASILADAALQTLSSRGVGIICLLPTKGK